MAKDKDIEIRANQLVMRPVRMVVLYKPTNEAAMKEVPLANCRHYFEACVKSMKTMHPEALETDFIAVQIDWEDKTIITSNL